MTGGRCHGPDCSRDAVIEDGFCSEAHQAAWHAQFDEQARRRELNQQALRDNPELRESAAECFRVLDEAIERTAPRPEPHPTQADLNAALTIAATGGFIGPPREPSDDRIPAVLSEGGCLAFWRGDHSGNHPDDPETPPRASTLSSAMGAVLAEDVARNLREALPALMAGATGMSGLFAHRAEVERQQARLRAACPEHADEALAEARHRAYTSLSTYQQAVDSVIKDAALGKFPSANAESAQVAPPNPQVGFLARAFHWLFGRTT